MIEGLLNIRNLLTLTGQTADALFLKSGSVVKAQVIDVSDDGSALLRLLLSGGKNMQGTVIKAKSEIPLTKGQNIFLEIFGGKNNLTMRFLGDAEGALRAGTRTVPAKTLDMLMQLAAARRSGPEAGQLLSMLKSIPKSIQNALPEFRHLEKILAAVKQLDPALLKTLSESSEIPLQNRLATTLMSNDSGTLLQKLQSLQADGDMRTTLQRVAQMLRDPGLRSSLEQAGMRASDLRHAVDLLLKNLNGEHEIRARSSGGPGELAAAVQNNVPARFLEMLSQLSDARLNNSEFKLFLNLIRGLPPAIRTALPELTGLQDLWSAQQLDGKRIKAFVEKSGVTFETKLTIAVMKDPGQVLQSLLALQTEGDFKSLLLKLKKLLGDRDMSVVLKQAGFKSADLSRTVEKFLENIEFYQLTSKLNDMLYTFLPVVWDGLNDGELLFKKNKDGQTNSYTCDINLDLESLGRLSVSITITGNQFFVSFFTDCEETERLIQAHKHVLQERFSSQGLQLKALNLCRKNEIPFGRSQPQGVNVTA